MSQLNKDNSFDVVLSVKVGLRVLIIIHSLISVSFCNTDISRIASTTFEKIHYFGSQGTRKFVFKSKKITNSAVCCKNHLDITAGHFLE